MSSGATANLQLHTRAHNDSCTAGHVRERMIDVALFSGETDDGVVAIWPFHIYALAEEKAARLVANI